MKPAGLILILMLSISSRVAFCQVGSNDTLLAEHTDTIQVAVPVSLTDTIILRSGITYILTEVQFEMDQHKLTRNSKKELDRLCTLLAAHPSQTIHIEGHVCCVKDVPDALDKDSNEPKLSVNRARAVYDYLGSKGIDTRRMTYHGMGHRRPIIANEITSEDAAINRRLEIRLSGN